MDVFTGLGLAAPAGLNAYIPLLTVGLMARFTNFITLESPWDILASDAGLLTLTVLLVIELFADAIPGLDHVNDLVQTVIRPASGAAVMLATNGEAFDINPTVSGTMGLILAGSVHALKAFGRPFVTASTAGLGNPVVSTIENVVAVFLSIAAILAPVLVAGAATIVLFVAARWLLRRTLRTAV